MWRDGGQADKLSACSAVLVWSASARNMSVFAAAGGGDPAALWSPSQKFSGLANTVGEITWQTKHNRLTRYANTYTHPGSLSTNPFHSKTVLYTRLLPPPETKWWTLECNYICVEQNFHSTFMDVRLTGNGLTVFSLSVSTTWRWSAMFTCNWTKIAHMIMWRSLFFFFSLISHYLFLCHLWFQGGPLHYFVSLQFQVKSPKLKKANQEIYFEQRLRSFSWIWATQRPSELKLHVNKTQFKVKISDILFLIMYWLHGSYHKN